MHATTRHPWRAAAALALAAAAFSAPARADYLWLQPEGAEARAYVGEVHRPMTRLPGLRDPRPVLPGGRAAPVDARAGHFAFQAGEGDQRFTATRTGSDGVLTYYQARFGRGETQAVNDLELVPVEPNGNTFRLLFKGRQVAASQVNVDTSEGWRRVLAPAQDGTVSFTPAFPGLYVLEVTARVDNGSVTLDGKTYGDVRHTATLSFEIPR